MPSPTPYSLSYDFTAFQSASPDTPLPADRIEIEFNNLEITTDEIIANLDLIQRSDGELLNGIVEFDSLSPTVQALLGSAINPAGDWLTSTAYEILDLVNHSGSTYICAIDHTSGTFATDLAAGKWILWAASGGVTINNDNWSGTDLAVANGGTGVSTLTGIVKGNGTSPFSAATEGTDYYKPGATDVIVADGGTGRSSHTAYAVLCGGTTSTAAQQSVASVGTAGQVLKSNGAGALPSFQDGAGGLSSVQVFTSSGTYTKPAGISKIVVEICGGGGGGQYAVSSDKVGGGGGGGGYSKKLIDASGITTVAVTIGAAGTAGNKTGPVTAGAGGTTSFGAYCSATGGTAGQADGTAPYGGDGGVGSGGDINIDGEYVTSASTYNVTAGGFLIGGRGGNSAFGWGAKGTDNADGNSGIGYGSGGSGGSCNNTTASGGAGKKGICIVWEFA